MLYASSIRFRILEHDRGFPDQPIEGHFPVPNRNPDDWHADWAHSGNILLRDTSTFCQLYGICDESCDLASCIISMTHFTLSGYI